MYKGNSQIEELFTEAWQKAVAGDSIESVISGYPDHATALGPMLRLAAAMRDMPQPALSAQALAHIRERTQAAAQEHARVTTVRPVGAGQRPGTANPVLRRGSWLSMFVPRPPALRLGVAALLVLLVAGVALTAVALTRQPNPRQPLETYSGVITKMTASGWMVGETEVLVDSTTEIHGQPALGVSMICIGQSLPGDRMRALEVWIGGAPGAPTVPPSRPTEQSRGAINRAPIAQYVWCAST